MLSEHDMYKFMYSRINKNETITYENFKTLLKNQYERNKTKTKTPRYNTDFLITKNTCNEWKIYKNDQLNEIIYSLLQNKINNDKVKFFREHMENNEYFLLLNKHFFSDLSILETVFQKNYEKIVFIDKYFEMVYSLKDVIFQYLNNKNLINFIVDFSNSKKYPMTYEYLLQFLVVVSNFDKFDFIKKFCEFENINIGMITRYLEKIGLTSSFNFSHLYLPNLTIQPNIYNEMKIIIGDILSKNNSVTIYDVLYNITNVKWNFYCLGLNESFLKSLDEFIKNDNDHIKIIENGVKNFEADKNRFEFINEKLYIPVEVNTTVKESEKINYSLEKKIKEKNNIIHEINTYGIYNWFLINSIDKFIFINSISDERKFNKMVLYEHNYDPETFEEFIKLRPNDNWYWKKITMMLCHKNNIIIKNINKKLDFELLSQYSPFIMKLVKKFPNKPWNYDIIACNKYINKDFFLKKVVDKMPLLKLNILSKFSKYIEYLVLTFPNKNWNYNRIMERNDKKLRLFFKNKIIPRFMNNKRCIKKLEETSIHIIYYVMKLPNIDWNYSRIFTNKYSNKTMFVDFVLSKMKYKAKNMEELFPKIIPENIINYEVRQYFYKKIEQSEYFNFFSENYISCHYDTAMTKEYLIKYIDNKNRWDLFCFSNALNRTCREFPDVLELVMLYPTRCWNWLNIIFNENLNKESEFLKHFDYKLDFSKLGFNINIVINILYNSKQHNIISKILCVKSVIPKEYALEYNWLIKREDIIFLSIIKNISLSDIKKYKSIEWDWESILRYSENINEIYKEFPNKPWINTTNFIRINKKITLDIINSYVNKETLNGLEKTYEVSFFVQSLYTDLNNLCDDPEINWNYKKMSSSKDISFEFVKKNINKDWDLEELCKNSFEKEEYMFYKNIHKKYFLEHILFEMSAITQSPQSYFGKEYVKELIEKYQN